MRIGITYAWHETEPCRKVVHIFYFGVLVCMYEVLYSTYFISLHRGTSTGSDCSAVSVPIPAHMPASWRRASRALNTRKRKCLVCLFAVCYLLKYLMWIGRVHVLAELISIGLFAVAFVWMLLRLCRSGVCWRYCTGFVWFVFGVWFQGYVCGCVCVLQYVTNNTHCWRKSWIT